MSRKHSISATVKIALNPNAVKERILRHNIAPSLPVELLNSILFVVK